jgi:hypothetical protein
MKGAKPEPDARIRINARAGIARLVVSPQQLQRALLVVQGIYAEAERRGYEVQAVEKTHYDSRAGIAIAANGHAYAVEITEQTDRIALTHAELSRLERQRRPWDTSAPATHKPVANGKLRLTLPSHGGGGVRSSWADGARTTLEENIASFFPELERRIADDDRRAEELRQRQNEWRRAEAERQARELRARIEKARASRLTDEVGLWRLAADARLYIAQLRERLPGLDETERERVSAWCDWASAWVAHSDPTTNLQRIRGLDDEQDSRFIPPRPY